MIQPAPEERREVPRHTARHWAWLVCGAGMKILGAIGRYSLFPPAVGQGAAERLILFTRYPAPGRTKTRLIPALGSLGAAELQQRMTQRALAAARQTIGDQREVRVCYEGGQPRAMRRWLGGGIRYDRQQGGDLGRRMRAAFADAFRAGCERVVIIGTDMPQCSPGRLNGAFAALDDHDLVLGPTEDGGYWLIGLRRPAEIFDGIDWGTDTVLQATCAAADKAGLTTRLLDVVADVDRPDDLAALGEEFLPRRPYLSVIIPTLNEADCVGRAIRSASRRGVEVLVCDGGSQDATRRDAHRQGARVFACEAGRARQMNHAAAQASGEVLLFLHADTILPVHYDRWVFLAMLDAATVGGAFQLLTDIGGPIMSLIDWLARLRTNVLHLPYGDQAIFVRRTVFEAIGGFPEVPVAEDLLFMRELRRLGRIALAPASVVTSGRRWRRVGLLRGLVINQAIALGCRFGVPLNLLARMYDDEGMG